MRKFNKIHEEPTALVVQIIKRMIKEGNVDLLKNITGIEGDKLSDSEIRELRNISGPDIDDAIELWILQYTKKMNYLQLIQHYAPMEIKNKLANREAINTTIYSGYFVAPNIQQWIETNDLEHDSVQINEITFNVITSSGLTYNLNWSIIKYILKTLQKIYGPLNRTIFLYLTPLIKQLLPKMNKVTCTHVNGGYNWNAKNLIVIWRCEELYKVLIHELLHAYGVGDVLMSSRVKNEFSQYAVHGNILPFEAVVESAALYLYLKIMEKWLHVVKEDIFPAEIQHSVLQVAKILDYFGFTNIQELWRTNKFIYQDSCVFSYYILKAALFYNYAEFLSYYKKDPLLNDYEKNISLLNNSMKNPVFQNHVNQAMLLYNMDLNMRMTIFTHPAIEIIK